MKPPTIAIHRQGQWKGGWVLGRQGVGETGWVGGWWVRSIAMGNLRTNTPVPILQIPCKMHEIVSMEFTNIHFIFGVHDLRWCGASARSF